jgi:hypothetical protein
MKQRIGLAAAWLAATALAVGIASQAVGLVGDRAEEVPVAVPIVGAEQSALGPLTTMAPPISSATTTTRPPTSSMTPPSTTAVPSTASPPRSSTTTLASTTTTVVTTSTTTTPLPPLESGTFVATGGQVTAACTGPDAIALKGAVPVSGWSVEVESSGPEKVRVDFEKGEQESEIALRCDAGRLVSEHP